MRSLKRFSVALVLGLTWACGGSEAGTDAGPADAGGQDAGTRDAGPMDVDPPVIVSTDPADATLPIGVLTTFSAVVSETLDPESVSDATIGLTDEFGNDVPGHIEYDLLTQTIRFDPALALRTGTGYTLSIGAIRDRAGNALADPFVVHAKTYVNPESGNSAYSSSTGLITQHTDYELDEAGDVTADTYYDAPGDDGVWYTSDDVIASVETVERSGTQRIWRSATDPGADGVFHTADDVVTWIVVQVLEEHERVVRDYNLDPGPDGMLDTADDAPTGYTVTGYDPSGLVANSAYYAEAGSDGEWFTADDVARGRASITTWDVSGRVTEILDYQGPGSDGVWFTDDDVMRSHTRGTYDVSARTAAQRSTTPGPDGTDGTADDLVQAYALGQLDADGRVVDVLRYGAAGADGEWETEDDVVSQRIVWTFGAHDNVTHELRYSGAGPDGRWGTADDRLSAVLTHDTER